ncbi:MAG: VOC family protein [Aristaeellaceae bacterium]
MAQESPVIRLSATTIDCRDHRALAKFYARLMGWTVFWEDEEYACVGAPGTGQAEYPGLTFQRCDAYVPPVWPEEPGRQQTMEHLDFAVADLPAAVEHALACGATRAREQYSTDWTVMLDPEGHPFCLCLLGGLLSRSDCALR